ERDRKEQRTPHASKKEVSHRFVEMDLRVAVKAAARELEELPEERNGSRHAKQDEKARRASGVSEPGRPDAHGLREEERDGRPAQHVKDRVQAPVVLSTDGGEELVHQDDAHRSPSGPEQEPSEARHNSQ